MTIQWSLLVPGLLLLLYPAEGLLSARVELRRFDSFRSLENSPRHRPWWWVPALWIDPLRAVAGAFLLQHAFGVVSGNWMQPDAGYWWMTGVLAVAVLSQIFTRRERGVLLAPIGFVAGILVALLPWQVASISLIMAIVGLFGFRKFDAFFTVGLGAVGLLGVVMQVAIPWLAPALGVLALPIVVAFLSGSTLELPTRNDAGPARRKLPV